MTLKLNKLKLDNFIFLADDRCYCIVRQQTVGERHFAYAMTVPEKTENIAEAELVILESIITENGQIKTREFVETEEDYQEIVKQFAELYAKNLENRG